MDPEPPERLTSSDLKGSINPGHDDLHSFIWKITSRCNLNCTYCFVYNSVDQLWRQQPPRMSDDTARQTARRVREYLEARGKHDVMIIFHGGEPMIGGVRALSRLVQIIDEELPADNFKVSLSMQTNLLLFDDEVGAFLLERDIRVGVSIDGPPEVNDRFRVDHQGRPSSVTLTRKLDLISAPRYRRIFSGFLCVVDVTASPVDVLDYLASWNPPAIDFLLPHQNHDRPPPGKQSDLEAVPYGTWLCAAFDRSLQLKSRPQIRIFDTLLRLMAGYPSLVETFGLQPNTLVVVETNGDIEAVDTLKTTYEGAASLNMNVFVNSFEQAVLAPIIQNRRNGLSNLCQTCKECGIVRICGGGYYPHRYSSTNGFMNPTVYCSDIKLLTKHIYTCVKSELQTADL
jgi:uncharacterized protein